MAPIVDWLNVLLGHPRVDIGRALIDHFGDLQALALADPEELSMVQGITPTRAARLVAAFQLGRATCLQGPTPTRIDSPETSARLLWPYLLGQTQECLVALYLNRTLRSKGVRVLTRGNDQFTVVCPRQVLRPALQLRACSIVLAHNHPSGDSTPSVRDQEVTQRVAKACRALGIDLIDHLIFTDQNWTSMAQLNATPNLGRTTTRWLH